MPQVDMPLEELKQYRGRNPKPADFDSFWNTARNEVEEQRKAPQWQDADFSSPAAECRHMFFEGTGGSRIHARAILPANRKKPVPALLHFHGYSGSAGAWTEYLAYAAAGFAVFALDCRGQGGWSEDRAASAGPTLFGHIVRGLEGEPEELYYRSAFQDVMQLALTVMDLDFVDETRVGAFGNSQGGALTIACASLIPEICALVPLHPFLSDYKRVWEMDLARGAYAGLSDYFRKFDPLHEREEEIFNTLGYIDIQHLADRIRGRVLFGATLMDETCPPSTQFAVYNRIESPREMLIFQDYRHEHIPVFQDKTYEFFCRTMLEGPSID